MNTQVKKNSKRATIYVLYITKNMQTPDQSHPDVLVERLIPD